ncbi:hypothetical protein SETIT_9G331900v2 [Setaria italica]|uniref:Ribonucleotide reductase large subunit N-terminal domain-containing protein n=1 Tax=Setaria italica TaxID=4555 RepID=K4AGZ4_SETIT|nr:hypothetical protein SETIT_9G331900v2 [Setaria italica]
MKLGGQMGMRRMSLHIAQVIRWKRSPTDENAACLDNEIKYDQDFDYHYFGFKTQQRYYLLKPGGKVDERPQDMLMRVSVGIHKDDTLYKNCTIYKRLACYYIRLPHL